MTMKTVLKYLALIFITLLVFSCASDDSDQAGNITYELPDNGIAIENAWARPGRINGVSAVYLDLLNGSSESDTLIELSAPVAGLVELHETFDRGDGMMGMRQVEEPVFPGREVTVMKPGGLHIMLMQLIQPLNEGDEVTLTLNFTEAGEITITAPVRSPGQ